MSSTNFVDNVTVIEADWCNDVNDFVYKNDSQYNAGTFNVSESLCVGTNVATSPATVNGIIESQVGGFKFPDGTIQTTASTGGGGGSGTVTSVSVATAHGFSGTVANATTTPEITLSTSVTGIVKGNGTSLTAATAGTDYVVPNGALGTPSSGNLLHCTFPTLNQDTTGNAATATYATTAGSATTASTATNAGHATTADSATTATNATHATTADSATTAATATTATNVSGVVGISNGGTGQTTASAAFNALSPVTTTGDLIIGNGTNSTTRLPIGTNAYVLTSNGTTASWQPNTGGGGGGDVYGPASSTDNAIVRFDSTTGKIIQNSSVTIDDAGNIISPDSIQFSGTIPATQPSGTFWFDSATNTFNLQQNAITQQVGEELFIYGKASATITEGQLIVKTGTVGASGTITFGPSPTGLAVNDGIIGVATENIASGSFGRITTFGIVHNINTTGTSVGETWADNDTLYYNPSYAGGLTNVKPAAPNIKYEVATVIHAGSGGSGSIQVNLQPGSTLGGTDSNVQFGTINTNNLIQYDGTKWTNVTPASVTGIGSVANTLTVNNSGSGDASGSTYNGSAAKTISYNSIGAQPTLVSGTNIKTVNSSSLLGSGDLSVGTVTNVSAITLGTTGTDLSSSVATGTSTPVITLNVPTASATNRGALSNTDWSTFNSKQDALVSGTNIKTINGTSLLGSGDITISGGGVAYTRTSFTATAGQTVFSAAYTVGYVEVFVNGVLLNGTDYTATNGTSITLATAAAVGDIVETIAYGTSTVSLTTATALAGGTSGQLVYQSAPDTTAFVTNGTAGQALISNGTSAPTWGATTMTAVNFVASGITKSTAYNETKVAIAASAIDLATANYFSKTISGATTFTVSNTPTTGTAISFILDLTNGGSATITWWSGMKWAGGTAPTLTTAGRDVLGFFTYDGGTTWTGLVLGKDVK